MLVDRFKKILSNEYAFLLVFVFYIPLLFLGFGTDSDTYTALNAWNYFLQNHDYLPSRLPGYVIHEIGIYYATKFGGSFLSNFFSLFFAVVCCYFLIKILKHLSIPARTILLVILNPIFIVNATSTVDNIWALCFFIIGFYFLLQGNIFPSSIFFAFSIGIRLSYGIFVFFIFFIYFFQYFSQNHKIIIKFLVGGLIILLFNFAAYYLPLDFTDWKLSIFLNASLGDETFWSPLMRLGRWGYKNILFWGFPSILLILALFISKIKKMIAVKNLSERNLVFVVVMIFFLVEILFLKYPIEIEYLIPILPFSALFLGWLFKTNRWVIPVCSIILLCNGVINFSLAQPDVPNHASSAKFEFSPVPGYLLSDIMNRPEFETHYYNDSNWWYVERFSN